MTQEKYTNPESKETEGCPSPDGGHCWHIHRGEALDGRLVRYCCWCNTRSGVENFEHGKFKETSDEPT